MQFFYIIALIFMIHSNPLVAKLTENPKQQELEDFPPYDPLTFETFKGTILDVQRIHFANRPSPYIQVILRTEDGEFSVEVGPEWYLQTQGITLMTKEEIEVSGSVVLVNGRPLILASRIRNRNETLQLRDASGNQLW